MRVTRADVENAARLARLQLDDADVGQLVTELHGILEHMTALRSVEGHAVEPVAGAGADTAVPRRDLPGADALLGDIAGIAAAWRDGYFTVPLLAAQARPGVRRESMGLPSPPAEP